MPRIPTGTVAHYYEGVGPTKKILLVKVLTSQGRFVCGKKGHTYRFRQLSEVGNTDRIYVCTKCGHTARPSDVRLTREEALGLKAPEPVNGSTSLPLSRPVAGAGRLRRSRHLST